MKCDASGIAIGALLIQNDKTIAYFSEKVNESKQNYSSYDNEFYVIFKELKKWRHYLFPNEFVLYIDNHALQFISSQTKVES